MEVSCCVGANSRISTELPMNFTPRSSQTWATAEELKSIQIRSQPWSIRVLAHRASVVGSLKELDHRVTTLASGLVAATPAAKPFSCLMGSGKGILEQ